MCKFTGTNPVFILFEGSTSSKNNIEAIFTSANPFSHYLKAIIKCSNVK